MRRTVPAILLLSGSLIALPAPSYAATPEPHQVSANLPAGAGQAGRWIENGKLFVAVTSDAAAAQARAAGATPKTVARTQQQLDSLLAKVDQIARTQDNLRSWGIDPVSNQVVVKARGGSAAFKGLDGVRVESVATTFVQQAGEVNPGDPWWPGSESNCSV